jgi:hypothetical protein
MRVHSFSNGRRRGLLVGRLFTDKMFSVRRKRLFVSSLIVFIGVLGCNRNSAPTVGIPTGEPLTDQPPAIPSTNRLSTSPLCMDPAPTLMTGLDVFTEPALPEPAPRLAFRDPIFGSCLVRVTDRSSNLAAEDTSVGLKNEYARVQSFNADESRILVRGIAGTWYLYDARTFQSLGRLPLDVDPRWSASNPNLIYYSSDTRLMSYDVQTGKQATVHDFAGDFPGQNLAAVWTRYEGSPSFDGRYWGLMAEDENWLGVAYLVYDVQEDRVVSTLDTRTWPAQVRESDSVTISPLGNYFLAYMDKYCEPGRLGNAAQPCGLMVYDRNLKNGRGLLRIVGHSDGAVDAQGREVLVYQDVDTDYISMLDLASGTISPLWPIDFSHTPIGLHISGRASLLPGWAVISTHDGDPASHTWMDDQVFAIEIKPEGRVVRFAHTHSLVDASQEHDYWAEPHASPNHDLTRILFTSNWGRSGTEEVEMYLIELPPAWSSQLP